MTVKHWLSFEQEVDLEIDPSDIIQNLPGSLDGEHVGALQDLVSRCHQCLKVVPDAMIEQLSDRARQLIADALRSHADRFAPIADPSLSVWCTCGNRKERNAKQCKRCRQTEGTAEQASSDSRTEHP